MAEIVRVEKQNRSFFTVTWVAGGPSLWGDKPNFREISSIAAGIARNQRQAAHGGMGTDKEIRQNTGTGPADPAIQLEDFPARKSGSLGIAAIDTAAVAIIASSSSIA